MRLGPIEVVRVDEYELMREEAAALLKTSLNLDSALTNAKKEFEQLNLKHGLNIAAIRNAIFEMRDKSTEYAKNNYEYILHLTHSEFSVLNVLVENNLRSHKMPGAVYLGQFLGGVMININELISRWYVEVREKGVVHGKGKMGKVRKV